MHKEDDPTKTPAEEEVPPQKSGNGNGDEQDRLAQPVDVEEPPRLPFPVIGIGGSAGGLEAFTELFDIMPAEMGMAFVVIQHLPPDRESMVAEILAKHTDMPVHQVEDRMKVQSDHVYVIRPGHTLTIKNGYLHLGEPVEKIGHRRPVDDFFRSLAEEQRERAIAIVMSGMGSNGAAGAQSIKAVGGVCIAQDPETCKHSSMPRALIDSGHADFVLKPQDIPEVLRRYADHPYARNRSAAEESLQREHQAFSEILALLRTRARQDFSGYKKPTVLRRIQRRMGLHQVMNLVDYSRLLRHNPSEAEMLADDLVIHVTGFFRDNEAWAALNERVIKPMIADREPDSSVRIWVTACSGGEEAYTLAMLLTEAMEEANKPLDVRIFATDIADRMLHMARSGAYPTGIEAELTPQRLEKFFEKVDATYRVRKELREMVTFAPQNILQDPPFSPLDICTCRNLLIYLEPDVQRRVLALLHFGIREGGALFLGNSETVAGADELFEPIDKKWRIYRRVGPARHREIDFPILLRGSRDEGKMPLARPPAKPSLENLVQHMLVERFTPPAVAIDRNQRVLYFHGDTGPFLVPPQGEPTRELMQVAREGVRPALRAALQRVADTGHATTVRDGLIETAEGRVRVSITVARLDIRNTSGYLLVTFETMPEPLAALPAGEISTEARTEIVEELERVRDELQSTNEELQTTNEELKASNEEVTSVNEELQSTNEELETSKEELQSLNEELTTVNAQLQAKMEEHEATTNDLTALLTSLDIAVIFLDRDFRIRRFTLAMGDLVDMLSTDVGRPLSDLAPKFDDPNLMSDCRQVLEKLIPLESLIRTRDGKWYTRRVLPYRTGDNRIDGVVITFIDYTRTREVEEQYEEQAKLYRTIVEGVRDYAIFMLDPTGKIVVWNVGAERVLGFSEREAVGQNGRMIYTIEDQANGEAEKELKTAADTGHSLDERWHVRKGGERFWGSGIVTAVRREDGVLRGFVKVMRDNTDRKVSDQHLENARRAAVAANESKDQFLAIVSHELRTPLSVILLWTKMVRAGLPHDELTEALTAIESSAEAQKQLIDDLLDTSRISAGKLRLSIRETDLVESMRGAVNTIRPAAEARSIKIKEDYADDIGIVQVDPDRFQQIVWNLLSNAVKFTPENGRVEISVTRHDDGVEIRIQDTGKGIDSEFLPHLFEPFKQAQSVQTRSYGGLGLGLAISRQLVELHGGTIKAHSEGVDKGSTFIVRLRLPRLKRAKAKASGKTTPEQLSDHPLEGTRILLVEDNPETAKAVAKLLKNTGAAVTSVLSAAEALKAFAKDPPDLILSDIAMPDMDGYTLIQKIREREKAKKTDPIPAVSLSAFTRDEDRIKAIESGFIDHVAKPVDPQQLISTLSKALNRA